MCHSSATLPGVAFVYSSVQNARGGANRLGFFSGEKVKLVSLSEARSFAARAATVAKVHVFARSI